MAQATNYRGIVLTSRHLMFNNTVEGFEMLHRWIEGLQQKHRLNSVIIGMEPTGHPGELGGHASDILIRGCEFDNWEFFQRYGAHGCIRIKSHGFKGKFNKSIIIANNRIKSSGIGIHAADVDNVYLIGNIFEKIDVPFLQDDPNIGRIWTH